MQPWTSETSLKGIPAPKAKKKEVLGLLAITLITLDAICEKIIAEVILLEIEKSQIVSFFIRANIKWYLKPVIVSNASSFSAGTKKQMCYTRWTFHAENAHRRGKCHCPADQFDWFGFSRFTTYKYQHSDFVGIIQLCQTAGQWYFLFLI